jgi:short subunit dehydrogenase-like uncharacterized protein
VNRPHVVIVGASGVFGSRLARLLAGRQAYQVTLAGRTLGKILPLQPELTKTHLDGKYESVVLNRDLVQPQDLRLLCCHVVVDCSGPFQTRGTNLIEAAIGAHCHWIWRTPELSSPRLAVLILRPRRPA